MAREVAELLEAHFSGELDEAGAAALRVWLREDPRRYLLLAAESRLEAALNQVYAARRLQDVFDTAGVFDELMRDAEAQPTELVDLTDALKQERLDDAVERGRLAAKDSERRIVIIIPKSVVYAGVAALVLMSLLLLVRFGGSDDHAAPAPIAEAEQPQPAPAMVRLTRQRDSRWATAAPAVGDAIETGRVLILSNGFAEITTGDGAVAQLEGPCTFELIDGETIRLHTGRLVGICETESSKGLLVRTPHMDVTDLGTRFGVDADPRTTEVHVFEGEVQALRPDAPAGTEPVLLAAGQAARTSADTAEIAAINHNPARFSVFTTVQFPLPGTGQGLGVGQADPNWQVVAVDERQLDKPQALHVRDAPHYNLHIPGDPAASQFVTWLPGVEPPVGEFISYAFRTQITVPDAIDPSRAELLIRFMADNELVSIHVNGERIDVRDGAFLVAFDRWGGLSVSDHLVNGENTIVLEIRNHRTNETSADHVGLRMEWELVAEMSVFQENEQTP